MKGNMSVAVLGSNSFVPIVGASAGQARKNNDSAACACCYKQARRIAATTYLLRAGREHQANSTLE